MHNFDVIVIGLGGVGSAAAMHLARRGKNVCGIEQFSLNHHRGSSHGQSRVFRQAYFEHADYVPLLTRSYDLWRELELHASKQLLVQTGLLEIGPPDGVVIPGVLKSAKQHGLQVDELSREDCEKRYPQFRLPPEMNAVVERDAGLLLVEDCVQAHLDAARAAGAILHDEETVVNWISDGDGVTVKTDRGTYTADSLVITTGAWAAKLLADLRVELQVLRKHMHWFDPGSTDYHFDRGAGQGSPTFFYETPHGYYYGFPVIDAQGLKVCEHSGGEPVAEPADVDRSLDFSERGRVQEFVDEYLAKPTGRHQQHEVCLYTMTPDEHFVVDLHPEYPNVSFAAGLSGHGFKFTPVLGEILTKLATEQTKPSQIDFLGINRPST